MYSYKNIFVYLFFISNISWATQNENSINQETSLLSDVSYTFDQTKLSVAADSFHFLRSFVDYYYLLYKANRSHLSNIERLTKFSGWCVGDAHPENFGYLIQNDNTTSIFTINDVDDAGPCPVVLDLIRFLISLKLYDKNFELGDVISSYRDGLNQQTKDVPNKLLKMKNESEEKNISVSDKKIQNQKFIRTADLNEVSDLIKNEITQNIGQIFARDLSKQWKILDTVETSKVGGGSGGLVRYEVLVLDSTRLLHLEFKQQVQPSIYPIVTGVLPMQTERIEKTLFFEQGLNHSSFYSVVKINNLDMLVRPRFAGNVGVSLSLNDTQKINDVIAYEAFTLGQIHSRSVSNLNDYLDVLKNMLSADLVHEVNLFADFFDSKFNSLKPLQLESGINN